MVQNHIYTMLPFLTYMLGDKSNILLQFIPLLFMIPMIWDKLYEVYYWIIRPKNSITVIQKVDKKRGWGDQVNFAFESICFYFESNNVTSKNNDLFCEKAKLGYNYVYEDSEGASYCSYEPIFTPIGEKTSKYEHEEYKLKFNFYEDEQGKNVVISGAPINVLKKFINECIKSYERHLYLKTDDKKYIYSYVKDSELWEGKEIRVKKNMDNVFLSKKIKDKLIHDIEEFSKNKKFYEKVGIPYKRGYLLKGPPGTGKSSTVYAISEYLKWNIYKVSPKWFSRQDTRKSISLIPPKSIVLIEEIDTHVCDNRDAKKSKKKDKKKKDNEEGDKDSDESSDEDVENISDKKVDLSEMLDIIDGYEYLYECIVIFTTNYPEKLDSALIRAGRMDIHFDFGNLEYDEVMDAIKFFIGEDHSINVNPDINIESAKLLNEILIPNRNNHTDIQNILNKLD